MSAAPTHPVDVLLILARDDLVLLARRAGTGYADGQWNLPSGKVEFGEDAVSAVLREAAEEIGLQLDRSEARMVTAVHHRNTTGLARVGLVFAATHDPDRHGEPVNAEPHKCAEIAWFRADNLPAATYPYTAAAVDAWRAGEPLELSGWDR
ncbi:NUDIX domain-containing protein [Dactylosporangium matsuzakiense]|uniref:Nudix hydrolase domain-containing protein n=1 Tax=Dactylosporangium matsuzakiense TaxID=53360 RepID=A0A9W6KHJ5_9ACTN|nr:NUDIX domain-containing protein [Dactylosporangium matsuzakiense]GLL02192.1 hypothetical protein GCM10017581_039340 [Dactylosporangium matsuzakiense]